jgi:riboflavin kinase / FMN adenylyltransferase
VPIEDRATHPFYRGGTVVTVGTFDGVHRGHQDVLERLVRRADAAGLAALLITFDPHPLEVVRPASAPLLLSPGIERLEAVVECGVRHVAVVPFTPGLAQLSAEQFVDDVLLRRFGMRELLIGHDHGFGRGRAGDVDVLRRLGARRGFAVEVVDAVKTDEGRPISSTLVRGLVSAGELDAAADALGRRYGLVGRVVSGAGRGRGLGYPTLNIAPAHPRKLLPPIGVYAVLVETPRGRFGGMMNLGPRPTFGDETLLLEAHLFDAAGEFYGGTVRLEFVSRLRDVMKFPSPAALVEQLSRDSESARRALTQVL